MTLQQKQAMFAKNVSLLIECIFDCDYSVTFGEAWRTPEQAAIYAKEGKGIAHSLHTERLAIDLNLFDSAGKYVDNKEEYEKFGTYWKSLNPANRWGGDFVTIYHGKIDDANHFEMQNL